MGSRWREGPRRSLELPASERDAFYHTLLAHRYVKTRINNGAPIAYVEGWHVVAEANRIFGFDSWDRTTVSPVCVWSELQRGQTVCFYSTRVRIQVRAGGTTIIRDGIGTGVGRATSPDQAHEIALKAAETDATKRALATFGNPFGLGGSLTVGIISAKQRDINSGPYDDFLQTDAAINKGNSGGPLFNMDGEVIGVNTAIISPTGGSIGIGFAVPSDTALNVVEQLRQYGETRRGWLGVKIQTITEDIAETLGVKENSGALVSAVTPDSPAAKGGLEAGDVIMRFDGKDVTTMRGLPKIVAQTPIGKAVDVEVLRRGEKKSFKVAVGRLTEDDEKPDLPQSKADEQKAPEQKLMGLTLSVIDDQVRQRFGLDGKVKGVIVTEADPDSPAAQKGIKPGDIIVEAGQDPVNSPDDLGRSVEKIRKSGRKAVLLRVEDGKGDLRFVAVPVA